MKIFKILLPFFLSQLILSQTLKIDTLKNELVSDGANYFLLRVNDLHNAHILKIDLSNSKFCFETFRPNKLEKTSLQFSELAKTKKVIASINADFFSFENSWSANPQVQNGEPVLLFSPNRPQIIFSDCNNSKIEIIKFEGKIILIDTTYSFTNVNGNKYKKSISFHNYFLNPSRIDTTCKIIYLRKINQTKFLNDTSIFIIEENNYSDYKIAIPNSISLKSKINDTLKIIYQINPEIKNISNLVSGAGWLLNNNISDSIAWHKNEKLSKSFVNTIHPRSVVGFNLKENQFYFIAIDGRQNSSTGMTFFQIINLLNFLKISDALNFDGGGSTTLVINGVVVNSPSDVSGEREVANTLMLIERNN